MEKASLLYHVVLTADEHTRDTTHPKQQIMSTLWTAPADVAVVFQQIKAMPVCHPLKTNCTVTLCSAPELYIHCVCV